METKRCSKCKEVKPLKEFNKNRAMQDGLITIAKFVAEKKVQNGEKRTKKK